MIRIRRFTLLLSFAALRAGTIATSPAEAKRKVPFGFFGATDAASLGALVPGPVKKDTNNWAPRVGAAWSPAPGGGLMKTLFGSGDGVIRGGFGITYDILFYNLLTVDASNYPRVVVPRLDNAQNLYPNVQPLSGSAVFDPLASYVNTPDNAQNPRTNFWNLSIQRQIRSSYTFEVVKPHASRARLSS